MLARVSRRGPRSPYAVCMRMRRVCRYGLCVYRHYGCRRPADMRRRAADLPCCDSSCHRGRTCMQRCAPRRVGDTEHGGWRGVCRVSRLAHGPRSPVLWGRASACPLKVQPPYFVEDGSRIFAASAARHTRLSLSLSRGARGAGQCMHTRLLCAHGRALVAISLVLAGAGRRVARCVRRTVRHSVRRALLHPPADPPSTGCR